MARHARTDTEIAEAFGVSRQTVCQWRLSSDFPEKTKSGWNIDRVDAWAKANGKGPYRRGSGGEPATIDGLTLAEAKLRHTFEQSENERIRKERQLVEQAAELGEIVYASDVLGFHARMVATITAVHDALIDAVDRALPEKDPNDQQAYTEARERALGICRKLKADAFAAMEETS